jgi:hypothetical protein
MMCAGLPWSTWRCQAGIQTSFTSTSGRQAIGCKCSKAIPPLFCTCPLQAGRSQKALQADAGGGGRNAVLGAVTDRLHVFFYSTAVFINATPNCMQAAAAAMLFWELYHGALPAARLALTLHNMDSQGECSQEEFGFTGAAPQP